VPTASDVTIAYDAGPRTRLSDTLAARWQRWWFEPEAPINLGVCRLLFFGLLFQHVTFHSGPVSHWASIPAGFIRPVWLFEKLHLQVAPQSVLLALEIAWKASLLLSCVGLFTRVSTLAAAALTLYMVGVPYNYGKVDHMTAILVFTTGILALSRCGDAVSLDRLIRRRRDPSPVPPSGEYHWPVRMVWVLMSVLFFNAGMAKVLRGGPPWVTSDNFAVLLVQRHYMTSLPAVDWGLWIAKHPLLFKTFAAGSILAELFLFLALFSRRLRWVLPWALLAMQVGIGLLMRVWFTPYMYVYLFWLPWGEVYGRLTRRKLEPSLT
jgi:hypothetical protein